MLTIILIITLLVLLRNSRGDAYNYTDNNSTYTVNKTVEEMLTIILIITLLVLLTKQ